MDALTGCEVWATGFFLSKLKYARNRFVTRLKSHSGVRFYFGREMLHFSIENFRSCVFSRLQVLTQKNLVVLLSPQNCEINALKISDFWDQEEKYKDPSPARFIWAFTLFFHSSPIFITSFLSFWIQFCHLSLSALFHACLDPFLFFKFGCISIFLYYLWSSKHSRSSYSLSCAYFTIISPFTDREF